MPVLRIPLKLPLKELLPPYDHLMATTLPEFEQIKAQGLGPFKTENLQKTFCQDLTKERADVMVHSFSNFDTANQVVKALLDLRMKSALLDGQEPSKVWLERKDKFTGLTKTIKLVDSSPMGHATYCQMIS